MKKITILLLMSCAGLIGVAGCGQKGPLFLPGNPSEMRPQPPAAEEAPAAEDEDDEDDDEGDAGRTGAA